MVIKNKFRITKKRILKFKKIVLKGVGGGVNLGKLLFVQIIKGVKIPIMNNYSLVNFGGSISSN